MSHCRALSAAIAVMLLAACDGSQPPIVVPDAMVKHGPSIPTSDFSGGHRTFHYTGQKEVFRVPDGVYQIKVYALGGAGANNPRSPAYHFAHGGYGGRVKAMIPVTPGIKLLVYVGGNGSEPTGGFNGGGDGSTEDDADGFGGGGASDVRQGGNGLSNRI